MLSVKIKKDVWLIIKILDEDVLIFTKVNILYEIIIERRIKKVERNIATDLNKTNNISLYTGIFNA